MSVLLIISIIWFVSEIILSRMMRAKDTPENHDKSSLKVIWITIIVSIFLGIALSNTKLLISHSKALNFYNIGIALILLGLIVRWIAILTLKKSFKVHVTVSENQQIVQSGIYKYIRHPSYSGSLLSFLGLAITFNNWLALVIVFVPIMLAFLYRINVEEKALNKAFGDRYANYTISTRKLIPFIY
jgi:protein-S-isoprenylcysteine O-methyltransferase Ste14